MKAWLEHRRRRRAAQDAYLRQLTDEYAARLEANDPDALEASRDFYDNDGGSTRFEIGLAAYLVVLVITVVPLVGLFALIAHWTGK
ncbi:hypothetical protein NOZE110980_14870 [Nocardioides zeicaulis]